MTEQFSVSGKFNTAKAYAPYEQVDDLAKDQIREMTNNPALKGTSLIFMPDLHGGKGATIGTTIKYNSLKEAQVNPQWVGNDIACGLTSVRIGKIEEVDIDFDKIDVLAKELHKPVKWDKQYNVFNLSTNLWKKVGRVSGGNHFMSIDTMDGDYWITVHNGSLSLGQEIYKKHVDTSTNKKTDTSGVIEELKAQDKEKYIQPVLELIKELDIESNDGLLSGQDLEHYLQGIVRCINYAGINRIIVILRVLEVIFDKNYIGWSFNKHGELVPRYSKLEGSLTGDDKPLRMMDSPHNYIKRRGNGEIVVHKGACSAEKDEDVLIPINMRDGIIVAKGKGNPEWNYAAPHGAGRVMSRTKAKMNIDLDTYLNQTKDIRSISINENTLDEAPDAYKPMDYILDQIKDTVEVTGIMKPVYNFKVVDEEPHWMRKKKEKRANVNS